MFLIASQPDAVILCVNPYDDFNYIIKTKKFIESSTNAKVISIVVFPMDLKNPNYGFYGGTVQINDDKFTQMRSYLEKSLNIPIYLLGIDNKMDALIENIIDFF